ETVEFRQHAVEHDDVEAIGACALIAFPAVARDGRLMSSCSKARRDEPGGSLVVLDHKNLHAAELYPDSLRGRKGACVGRVFGFGWRHDSRRVSFASPARCIAGAAARRP